MVNTQQIAAAVASDRRQIRRDALNWMRARFPNEEVLESQTFVSKVYILSKNSDGSSQARVFPDDV